MERMPATWRWIFALLAFLLVMGAVAWMGGVVDGEKTGWLDCPPTGLALGSSGFALPY